MGRCGFALLIIDVCCVLSPAFGRDDGRFANSSLKPWLDSLKSGKGSCCSDADGSVVSDADWESKEGAIVSGSRANGTMFRTMPSSRRRTSMAARWCGRSRHGAGSSPSAALCRGGWAKPGERKARLHADARSERSRHRLDQIEQRAFDVSVVDMNLRVKAYRLFPVAARSLRQ